MAQEILPGLYKIDVPLPKNPLKALNCYVIKGNERNLIIDTGFDRAECRTALFAGLQELNVDLSKTDLFITHLHADHSGMIHRVASPASKVYASKPDAEIIIDGASQGGQFRNQMGKYAERSGFPIEELDAAVGKHPGYRYGAKGPLNFTYVSEGDTIEAAGYRFTCICTPGHTPAHMCLYEESKKILVSGDHILDNITPNIALWSDRYNSLQMYLDSLDKVARLEVTLTLPGHRSLMGDCKPRIAELKKHHEHRLAEVLEIITREGRLNAYQTAAQMTWDMTYKSWDDFPVTQRWFALGEAISHLKYLVDKGSICQTSEGEKIYYTVNI